MKPLIAQASNLLAQVSAHDVATYLPALGALLAGEGFWRLVVVLLLVGLPQREETRTRDGHLVTHWRWRGALAIGWEWARAERIRAEARRVEGNAFARVVQQFNRLVPSLERALGAKLGSDSDPPPPASQVESARDGALFEEQRGEG